MGVLGGTLLSVMVDLAYVPFRPDDLTAFLIQTYPEDGFEEFCWACTRPTHPLLDLAVEGVSSTLGFRPLAGGVVADVVVEFMLSLPHSGAGEFDLSLFDLHSIFWLPLRLIAKGKRLGGGGSGGNIFKR